MWRSAAPPPTWPPGDPSSLEDVLVRDLKQNTTETVSLSSAGVHADRPCQGASISADGRSVAFSTQSTNLAAGMNGTIENVYVRDRTLGTTELASVSSTGTLGNDMSYSPIISADGRFVSFVSMAASLVSGDVNGVKDIFVRDRQAGTTELASVNSSSAEGDHESNWGCVSADGRFVAFCSYADNLVANDTNLTWDVFVHERVAAYHQVSGTVDFDVYKGTPPATIPVHVTWNGYLFGDYDLAVAADGTYALSMPAGTLKLTTKPTHWLRRSVSADTSGRDATASIALTNGDASGDNHIGIADLSTVLANYQASDPMADLDGSGAVGIADISIVLLNYNLTGDQ